MYHLQEANAHARMFMFVCICDHITYRPGQGSRALCMFTLLRLYVTYTHTQLHTLVRGDAGLMCDAWWGGESPSTQGGPRRGTPRHAGAAGPPQRGGGAAGALAMSGWVGWAAAGEAGEGGPAPGSQSRGRAWGGKGTVQMEMAGGGGGLGHNCTSLFRCLPAGFLSSSCFPPEDKGWHFKFSLISPPSAHFSPQRVLGSLWTKCFFVCPPLWYVIWACTMLGGGGGIPTH